MCARGHVCVCVPVNVAGELNTPIVGLLCVLEHDDG